MKISMFDPSLFTGRYDDSLCSALAAEGHDVTLAGRPLRDTDAIKPSGYRYLPAFFSLSERLPASLAGGKLFRGAKALEYLVQCGIGGLPADNGHLIHSQWMPFGPADSRMMRRLRARHPLVHTVHNVQPFHADNVAKAVQGMGYSGSLAQFDALIVHGEGSRAALVDKGFDPATIAIVPHPPLKLAAADAQTLRAVPDAVLPRVLFFGTMRPYKGLDLLIAACITLWRAGHRFELSLAGKPFMLVEPLLEQVRSAGFAQMLRTDLGFLKEEKLDAHLQKADVLVFPYRHIDASGAFMSSLHYGKAMICSDVGMFATLPLVDGKSGVALCKAGDGDSLAHALLPVIESVAVRADYGARTLALARQLGTWKDTALETLKVYEMARVRARARGVVV